MTNPEKTQYDNFGLITQASAETVLPTLDTGERGLADSAVHDVVQTPDGWLVRKRPKNELTDTAIQGFNFFMHSLPNYPELQDRFPATVMKYNAYLLQEAVVSRPGKQNMSRLSNPSEFDMDQIDSPDVLNDIILVVNGGIGIFKDSLDNPNSGLEPDEGWCAEINRPDNYVLGVVNGDKKARAYYVDCLPIFPRSVAEVQTIIDKFNKMIDETSLHKFGMPTEEVLRRNGFDTPLPDLEDHKQSPRTVTKTRRIGAIALAT